MDQEQRTRLTLMDAKEFAASLLLLGFRKTDPQGDWVYRWLRHDFLIYFDSTDEKYNDVPRINLIPKGRPVQNYTDYSQVLKVLEDL
jgi:hypothetical protein